MLWGTGLGVFKTSATGKRLLTILQNKLHGVKTSTQNGFVYGELGRVSLQNGNFIR